MNPKVDTIVIPIIQREQTATTGVGRGILAIIGEVEAIMFPIQKQSSRPVAKNTGLILVAKMMY